MIFPFKITNINTNTNSRDWDELNSGKKKREKKWRTRWSKRGCETLGEEDERGRRLCDSVRSVTTRTKWSWESRELCLCLTACGLVAMWVRELRDVEGKAAMWDIEWESLGQRWEVGQLGRRWDWEWVRMWVKEIRGGGVSWNEMRNRNF